VTFEKYTYFANIWDIYAKCYRNDPVSCLWSKPVSDYFNNETVKRQLNVDEQKLNDTWMACDFENIVYKD
jgi:hypothetical protein